jgi:hypothetical protein
MKPLWKTRSLGTVSAACALLLVLNLVLAPALVLPYLLLLAPFLVIMDAAWKKSPPLFWRSLVVLSAIPALAILGSDMFRVWKSIDPDAMWTWYTTPVASPHALFLSGMVMLPLSMISTLHTLAKRNRQAP